MPVSIAILPADLFLGPTTPDVWPQSAPPPFPQGNPSATIVSPRNSLLVGLSQVDIYFSNDGVLFDPPTPIRVIVTQPDSTQTTYEYPGTINRTGVGSYSFYHTTNLIGMYKIELVTPYTAVGYIEAYQYQTSYGPTILTRTWDPDFKWDEIYWLGWL